MSGDAIGRLRARVSLEAPLLSPDDLGGDAIAFVASGSVWAELEAVSGSERGAQDGLIATGRWRARVRTPSDIAPGWRISHAGRAFRVIATLPDDPAHAFLRLELEEEQT